MTALAFGNAWKTRVTRRVSDLEVPFIGRSALLENKRATGRPKDLADIDALERAGAGDAIHRRFALSGYGPPLTLD